MSGRVRNFDIAIFSHTIDVTNVKICIFVLFLHLNVSYLSVCSSCYLRIWAVCDWSICMNNIMRILFFWMFVCIWLSGTYFFFFLQLYPPIGISPMGNRVAFPGESQLRQSRATQPTVHAGRFGVSIVHRTLTWTTESLTCAQMLTYAIVHGGAWTL